MVTQRQPFGSVDREIFDSRQQVFIDKRVINMKTTLGISVEKAGWYCFLPLRFLAQMVIEADKIFLCAELQKSAVIMFFFETAVPLHIYIEIAHKYCL